jgi:hypothetical protein
MGFFKKIFKSVKKGFKSIGKGIKSAFKKFGKFMNKIGIVGQLALMFTPIGGMMAGMFSKLGSAAGNLFGKVVGQAAGTAGTAAAGTAAAGTAAAGTAAAGTAAAGTAAAGSVASGTAAMLGGSTANLAGSGMLGHHNAIIRGAGKILEAGANFAKAGTSAFRTITDGIGSFVSEFSKTALKKIPGMEKIAPSLTSASDNFFTKSNVMVDGKMVSKSAWSTVQEKFVANVDLVGKAFQKVVNPEDFTNAQIQLAEEGIAQTGKGGDVAQADSKLFDENSMDSILARNKGPVEEKSFLGSFWDSSKETLTGEINNLKEKGIGAFIGDDPLDIGNKAVDKTLGYGIQRVIMGKPKAPTVYNVAAPRFDPTASVGSYSLPETNDMAAAIPLGGDFFQQGPYGFGANYYLESLQKNMAKGVMGGRMQ